MKVLKLFMAVTLALGLFTGAYAGAESPYALEGIILEVKEDGSFLVESTTLGEVLFRVDEETVLEGVAALAAGQYVFVEYGGVMTASLPPQTTARKITCHVIRGEVLSADEAGGMILVESETYGQVLVRLPEMDRPVQAGEFVTVYFNGIMAMSYPGQVGALKVDVYVRAQGTVTSIEEGFFLIEGENGILHVNFGADSQMPETLEAGDEVLVYHSGAMTRSLPPQVYGLIIEKVTEPDAVG